MGKPVTGQLRDWFGAKSRPLLGMNSLPANIELEKGIFWEEVGTGIFVMVHLYFPYSFNPHQRFISSLTSKLTG
jgi:hypothetical protein